MAAAHSNRSPSPISSRPTNPNSKNSEIYSTTRRSFNGNNNPFGKPHVLTNPRRFDPITPANSPSDFVVRRRSAGKESTSSCLRDCEQKENDEKDQIFKNSKLQSPAKGSKNFMAPTISAASKFTPSPRKKVLAERNDPVRTSISLSDGKAMFFSNTSEDFEPKSEMGYQQNQKNGSYVGSNVADLEKKEAVQESIPISKPSKKVTFLDVPQDSLHKPESQTESVITDFDHSKIEPSLINKSSYSSPIAPLDADPSLPPYDPKTNYLSPRPQFLHYKPNPRIEILLTKENGMDLNEADSFMGEIVSDNFSSDSEGTEYSQTEASEKEKLEAIASSDMVRGLEEIENDRHVIDEAYDSEKEKLEAIASAHMYEGLSEELENDCHIIDEAYDSEKEKLEAIASAHMYEGLSEELENYRHVIDEAYDSEKEKLEAIASAEMYEGLLEKTEDDLLFVQKNEKKPRSISRLVCFSMVMMMLIACASISVTRHSPLLQEFGLKDLSFADLGNLCHQSKVAANAKVKFDRLAGRINRISVNTMSLIYKVVNELGKGETLGPLKYMNLSDLQRDSWSGGRFMDDEVNEDLVEDRKEEDELDEDMDIEIDKFVEEEEAYEEVDNSDENFENELDNAREDDVLETEEKMSDDSAKLPESAVSECSEDIKSQSESVSSSVIISADQLAPIEQNQENKIEAEIEVIPSEVVEIEKSYHGDINLASSNLADITLSDHDSQLDVSSSSASVQSSSSEGKFLAHYYAVGILSLVTALLAVGAFIYHYKRNPSPRLANVVQPNNNGLSGIKHMYQEKALFGQQVEVDDVIGESCPSEMSSFQKSASFHSKKEMRGANNEVQSSERKTRKYYSKRESLASSSSEFTASPSYGSFTTFERIPIKHANGEEEIITPVRRSSRIWNQVTSPGSFGHGSLI